LDVGPHLEKKEDFSAGPGKGMTQPLNLIFPLRKAGLPPLFQELQLRPRLR
jgi:hypothetical protein